MDKQKQIESMVLAVYPWMMKVSNEERKDLMKHITCLPALEKLYNAGWRKIPENAVVLTEKEYKRYERIEKIIKLAKREKANGYEVKNGKFYYFSNMLGGCEIEFKDLQEICDALNHYNEEFWGLDQRLAFWQGKAETIGKETAEKFAERLKKRFFKSREYYSIDTGTAWSDGHIGGLINDTIDEIAKEITGGKE